MKINKMNKKVISVWLPEEYLAQLRVVAKARMMTLSSLIRETLGQRIPFETNGAERAFQEFLIAHSAPVENQTIRLEANKA